MKSKPNSSKNPIVVRPDMLIGDHEIKKLMKEFCDFCQLSDFEKVSKYLHLILDEHLSGYDYKTLNEDEFSHVGGPIILNIQGH